MIDNMLKTRKLALAKRKEQGKSDMHNLTELWYEEFLKLHPDYKSSKKNLWRKYKWYKSRMAEVKGENSANVPGILTYILLKCCDFTEKKLGFLKLIFSLLIFQLCLMKLNLTML